MLRIAYFTTSGRLAIEPLRALLDAGFAVDPIVRPAGPSRLRSRAADAARRLGLRPADPVADLAGARGIRVLRARSRGDLAVVRDLSRAKPDLICVSTFRWVLPEEIRTLPRLGGLNLHSSLLPRHRGPLPLFWTYHGDDREAGVTVHRLDPRPDAGDVLLREGAPLARGYPVEQLDADNARRGGPLLARAAAALADGSARFSAQRDDEATAAPLIRPGEPMVDFGTWPAERVRHFLGGLLPRYHEPLRDTAGDPVRYAAVGSHEPSRREAAPGALGRVERKGAEGALRCRDGWVRLELSR